MPGIYEEVVNIMGLYISLVGVDKYSCIIIDKSGQYVNAPINMGGGNLIANLTVIASHENVGSYTGEPSYAVHHDYGGEGESLIYNCTLKSYQSCAVGIGLQNNQQLTIKNSELITDTTGATYAGVGRPTLLMHPQVTTATNQKLIVDNCRLKCNGGIVMNLVDSNNNGASGGSADNRDTTLTFYNNILWSDVNGKTNVVTGTSAMGDGDYGYMKITGDSWGNNATELNR